MPDNSLLKSIKLPNYFTYFKENNILAISEDKSSLPFAFLIIEDEYKDLILLSISLTADPVLSADIALQASLFNEIMLIEAFYVSEVDGMTYFGNEATRQYNLENEIDLMQIESPSSQFH